MAYPQWYVEEERRRMWPPAEHGRKRTSYLKIGIVEEEEADESAYWLELLREAKMIDGRQVSTLLQEAHELTAIFTASGKTARRRSR